MSDFNEIQKEVNQSLQRLKEIEDSKPDYQLILESLNKTLVDSEQYLHRWDLLIKTFRKDSSFVQLCGMFLVEYAILLKERVILGVNHFIEKNRDSINIHYLLNILENSGKEIVGRDKYKELKLQINSDRNLLNDIIESNKSLISIRDKEIAHNDKKNLKNKYSAIDFNPNPELFREILKILDQLLSYYFEILNLEKKTFDKDRKFEIAAGLETGLEELVIVVNKAFLELKFEKPRIDKIADFYKLKEEAKNIS